MKKFFLAFNILNNSQKKNFSCVLLITIFGTILEAFGISIIMPMIDFVMYPDKVFQIEKIDFITKYYSIEDVSELILLGVLLIILVFSLKNIFLAYQVHFQAKFSFRIQEELSEAFFKNYLGRPYKFFITTNSSKILQNTIGEVNSFVGYVLQPSLIILTEGLVLISLTFLLIYIEPVATVLTFLILGGLGFFYNSYSSKRVANWGKARQHHEGLKIKVVQESFTGIKAVKLLKDPQPFTDRFKFHNVNGAQAARKQYASQQMPKLILEVLAIVGIAVVVFVLFGFEEENAKNLPKLGTMMFALFRLLPCLSRIVQSSQAITYGIPCIDVLGKELSSLKEVNKVLTKKKLDNFKDSFVMSGVSFTYPNEKKSALNDISIKISRGTSVGIVGESGSGKSTLVDLAMGLLIPEKGTIKIDGEILNQAISFDDWIEKVGYVPQEIFLTDEPMRNNIAFGIQESEIDEDQIWRALQEANLDDFVRTLPDCLNTQMGERGVRLSGGQRQRVGIARALYGNPDFIVLDEATSALDIETEESLIETLNKFKGEKTFLIIAHRLSALKNCDYLYCLKDGRVSKEGNAEEVVNMPSLK